MKNNDGKRLGKYGFLKNKLKELDYNLTTWHLLRTCEKSVNSGKWENVTNQCLLSKVQEKQIDDFYISNYGEKISYDWHRYYTALSGVFDPSFFPRTIYYPFLERILNVNEPYAYTFEDKIIIPFVASVAGVKMPKTILLSAEGICRDSDNHVVNPSHAIDIIKDKGNGKVFCKPATIFGGGKGCFVYETEKSGKKAEDVLLDLGRNFVVQELLECDSSIKAVYPSSVNTFRILTYRWKEDFYFMPAIMRIGAGGSVIDNATAGGMFVGVGDNGVLKGKAVCFDGRRYSEHPDTHVVFDGHKINNFSKVLESALKMHTLLPQLGVIGWDFTIDSNGDPVLIEANIRNTAFDFCQMCMGETSFGDRTVEVLQWIKKMKKAPYSQLKEHAFGN